MLVHMTPGEVQALQALAERHGGTLTINPETGQPEANFLKKILPMVAGFALGPAGFGLMSAGMAGAAVGGITALSTGSLSRGLMAGLGAYGGAGLAEGLAGMGSSAVGADALAAANASADPIASLAAAKDAATAAGTVAPTGFSAVAEGAKRAFTSPEGFKELGTSMGGMGKLAQTGLAAISPIMADEGVQTATPKQETGYIRQKKFNPYTQQYIDLEPVKSDEWGSRRFSDFAGGGIVALANGGTADQPLYLGLDKGSTPAQVAAAYSQFAGGAGGDTAANQREAVAFLQSRGIGDDVITNAYQQFLSPPQQAQAQSQGLGMTSAPVTTSAPATRSGYAPTASGAWSGASHTVDGIELVPGAPGYDPAKAAMRLAEISTYGGTAGAGAADTLRANNLYDTGMAQWQTEYNRLHQQDIDAGRVPVGTAAATVGAPKASATSATAGAPVPGSAAYNSMVGDWFSKYPNATAADIENAIRTNSLNRQDVFNSMGILGLSNAARYSAFHPDVGVPDTPQGGLAGLSSNINQWIQKYPTATRAEAEKAMNTWGYNEADIVRATGKTLDQLFTGPIEDVTFLPSGVSGGGNTIVNPNGTITTAPNIPGRPEGGFTGMGQVKDVYTQGGGSLGQSNLFVPKTLAEMYERYGNTGGSQQAYDYLMGKGSVDIKKPVTQSGELMLPYAQAVLGQEIAAASGRTTQKYLFDPKTRRYILNPAYVDPNAPKEKDTAAQTVVPPNAESTGAANGGVMRMALGGLGALAGGGATSQYNLGGYSDGGRLLRGPGDGVSDSIPATIGDKQPARLADGEFVVPARIVSELGNGSTEAGARKLYAMMDRVQKARGKTTGKNRVAANTRSDKYLPA
jgi:hypothetical protein